MAGVFQGLGVDGPRERRERREDAVRYLVRLELADVSRPVVSTVELASDMFLDEVSDVVQAAYGWLGYHLHRFAIGDPFAPGAEVYLCPFEVDDGEDGLDARDIRLDELLASPGDTCRYAYDYGDGWEVQLRLLDVLPAAVPDGPRVRCTTGEVRRPRRTVAAPVATTTSWQNRGRPTGSRSTRTRSTRSRSPAVSARSSGSGVADVGGSGRSATSGCWTGLSVTAYRLRQPDT